MKLLNVNSFIFMILVTGCCISIYGGQDSLILDEWATVNSVVGKAEIRSSDEGHWRPVHVGMRVKMAWDVRTHIESCVQLSFESGTEIKLGESSEVKLATLYNDTHNNVTAVTDKTENQ
jgi:hypothetical protein